MAIIVSHKETSQKYILLGTGFGIIRAMQESPMFRTLSPSKESNESKMVAVCDNSGKIIWFQSGDIEVIEIDGTSLTELL